ncbi:MAG TPA: glycosyltransferase family 39 protein [Roseiflexaceae bacterium]|nr:glycosyltransferase family 39 protein [Roseiflexaceae bacterium]
MAQIERRGRASVAVRPLPWAALGGLLVLPAAVLAARSLARLVALLGYPYPHDGLEGTLLHEAKLLRAGEQIYGPLELHRFVSAPYPPLHPLVLALADIYAGPHVFWSGRLISLIAAIAATALVAWIVRRTSGSWAAALVGAALFLSAPPVLLWGSRVKPDVMALCFTAAGLLFISLALDDRYRTTDDRRATGADDPSILVVGRRSLVVRHQSSVIGHRSVVFAALCFAGAFFTKQTDVAGPLAAGMALLADDVRTWWAGRLPRTLGAPIRPRTAAFALVYLTLALGGWALLEIATGGGYTLHVWWNFARLSWWSPGLFRKIAALLDFWWPMMVLSALTLALAWRRPALLVPASYVLVSPLTLLLAGEVGANHNHLLEAHMALAIAGGCALGWAFGALAGGRLSAAPLVVLAALQLWLAFSPPAWYEDQLEPKDPPERFLTFMRSTPGEILADDTGLLFQAGKPLRYDDPSTMGAAARSGAWDQRGLLEDIAARRFSAIMLPLDAEERSRDPSGRWTPEMLAAVRAHYRLAFRDRIYTFVPRSDRP